MSPGLMNVAYELRDDATEPATITVVSTGNLGIDFDPVQAPVVRRLALRQQLLDHFKLDIDKATAGDADIAPLTTALVGMRYPAKV